MSCSLKAYGHQPQRLTDAGGLRSTHSKSYLGIQVASAIVEAPPQLDSMITKSLGPISQICRWTGPPASGERIYASAVHDTVKSGPIWVP